MYLLHHKKIDIYANISLFLSYSEVTAVTRSDGGSAPRDDLYSPERQRRPGHLDEPQRQTPSEDPSIRTRPREPVEPLQSDFAAVGIELLCRLARGEMAPRLSLVSPKVFFSVLSPMEFWFLAAVAKACLVGDTSFPLCLWSGPDSHFTAGYILSI